MAVSDATITFLFAMGCKNMRILFLTTLLTASTMAAEQRLFIGTYTRGSDSQGIYTCLFDADTGTLSDPKLAVETDNPSFLAIHPTRDLLFACNETNDFEGEESGAVSSFRMDKQTGSLTLINQQSAGGGATCHMVVDQTGKFVLVANYTGGNVAVLPVNQDGSLGERSCLINHVGSGPDKQRQEAPHAHSINLSADNRFAYVADLGTDRVMIYRFDSERGLLVPSAADSAIIQAGGGPRHFALHPSGKFAYTNCELTCEAVAMSVNSVTGALSPFQIISTLPPDFDGRKSTAECLVHPTGRFLYVSNRGHDSIAVYDINPETGALSLVEIEKTTGEEPRNFVIHPSGKWLIAENQNSNDVVVFSINQQTGGLSPTAAKIAVARPVCIRMLP